MKTEHAARAELAAHRTELAGLLDQSRALQKRIVAFGQAAAAAEPPLHALEDARRARMEVLASVALRAVDVGVLDRSDLELLALESNARVAERDRDIATAGAARLTRDHEALAHLIAAETKRGPALSYAAALDIAQAKLAPYKAAAVAMGKAYAELMGAVLAAETFADVYAQPPRLFVRGSGGIQSSFTPALPEVPNIDAADWLIDISDQIEAATAAALAELQG